jgi:hypothetical protein
MQHVGTSVGVVEHAADLIGMPGIREVPVRSSS